MYHYYLTSQQISDIWGSIEDSLELHRYLYNETKKEEPKNPLLKDYKETIERLEKLEKIFDEEGTPF